MARDNCTKCGQESRVLDHVCSACQKKRVDDEVAVACGKAIETLKAIRNLSHNAWLDTKNVRTLFEMIEQRSNDAIRALAGGK